MRSSRVVGCAVVVAFGLSLVGVGGATADPPITVTGRDGPDTFVGAGLIPGSRSSTSSPGTGCADCVWVLEPVCTIDDMGTPPVPGSGNCLPVDGNCREGERYLREWTRSGSGPWHSPGVACVSGSPGVTISELTRDITDRVRHRLPPLVPAHQPRGRVLPAIPVLFRTGQRSPSVSWQDTVAGLAVRVSVSAQWRWSYGDGRVEITTDPGGRWPDAGVDHVYRGVGRYGVEVIAQWSGSFEVTGIGTFPISDQVEQQADHPVRVVPARAVLVPGRR